jgi:hypothetical protein
MDYVNNPKLDKTYRSTSTTGTPLPLKLAIQRIKRASVPTAAPTTAPAPAPATAPTTTHTSTPATASGTQAGDAAGALAASTSPSSSSNLALKVGVAVGVPLGILALILGSVALVLWRRSRQAHRPSVFDTEDQPEPVLPSIEK